MRKTSALPTDHRQGRCSRTDSRQIPRTQRPFMLMRGVFIVCARRTTDLRRFSAMNLCDHNKVHQPVAVAVMRWQGNGPQETTTRNKLQGRVPGRQRRQEREREREIYSSKIRRAPWVSTAVFVWVGLIEQRAWGRGCRHDGSLASFLTKS